MGDIISSAADILTLDTLLNVGSALLKLALGILLARVTSRGVVKLLSNRTTTHQAVLLQRVIFYVIAGLFVASALMTLGFDISVLLGAAGILTVAIGFASQTSASNVISGLFLLGEKPFSIGDIISVGTTTGAVLSVDLLSVKLRTFDNLFVRVPNETIIKSEITNLTRFPIRRFDVRMGVAYKENLNYVRDLLMDIAEKNPICLEDPKPLFIFTGFGESSLDFQFSVWAKRENFIDLRNTIQVQIKDAFDAGNVEIPFPHRTIYAGGVTDPFPVRMVKDDEHADAA